MSETFAIMAEGIPIGFFPNKQDAMDAMEYVESGYVAERLE